MQDIDGDIADEFLEEPKIKLLNKDDDRGHVTKHPKLDFLQTIYNQSKPGTVILGISNGNVKVEASSSMSHR